MTRNYKQGIYAPKNPQKYVGDANNIFFRSSWELKFMKWADSNPNVLKWNNEELVIPYLSPVDNMQHRYFVDFVVMVKTKSGEVRKYAVEIKPEAQTVPPKQTKKTKKYLTEMTTYMTNQAKWKAADAFCRNKGIEFVVLTERHLF
jgi:TnsA endonuclease N terminal